jgi:NRPS condensation-like uncharacterized protein
MEYNRNMETKQTNTEKALWVSSETHAAIKVEAAKCGLTINDMIMQIYITYVAALKREADKAREQLAKEIEL